MKKMCLILVALVMMVGTVAAGEWEAKEAAAEAERKAKEAVAAAWAEAERAEEEAAEEAKAAAAQEIMVAPQVGKDGTIGGLQPQAIRHACNIICNDNYAAGFINKTYGNTSKRTPLIRAETCRLVGKDMTTRFGSIQTQIADRSWGVGKLTSKSWENLCFNLDKFLASLTPEQFRKMLWFNSLITREYRPPEDQPNYPVGIGTVTSFASWHPSNNRWMLTFVNAINDLTPKNEISKKLKRIVGNILDGQYKNATAVLEAAAVGYDINRLEDICLGFDIILEARGF